MTQREAGDVDIQGSVAAGFERVRNEFERNLTKRGDLGASFAAFRGDEFLVDLWGGIADRSANTPWRKNTLQVIFSGTKGLVAICLLLLVDRGELDLNSRVAHYWPEFGSAGKDEVSVRQVVTHTARLPGLASVVSRDEVTDDRQMSQLLAAQAQLGDPRAARTYHPLTFGWLCGELVRRVDGRSIGNFFAEEVARPLDVEIYIGLPEHLEPQMSRLELAPTWGTADSVFNPDAHRYDDLMRMVWANPPIWGRDTLAWNDHRYHAAELPGAGGIGTARAIATLYGSLNRLLSPAALMLARTELEHRRDPLTDEPQSFGVGFELQTEHKPFGRPPDGFGHTGAGGSVHGLWPSHRVGFSYAMNHMRDDHPEGDPRPKALLSALRSSL